MFPCDAGSCLTSSADPTFFPGRAATIYYRRPRPEATGINALKEAFTHLHDEEIGVLGILHPTVLEKFEIGYPCSAVEFSLEPFRRDTHKVWSNME